MAFVNALIHDLEALELMIRDHALEKNDVQRIGAEQEMCPSTMSGGPIITT